MSAEPTLPQLTETEGAWLVEVPAGSGRCQRYRFVLESQARRFLALFTPRPPRSAPRPAAAQPTCDIAVTGLSRAAMNDGISEIEVTAKVMNAIAVSAHCAVGMMISLSLIMIS